MSNIKYNKYTKLTLIIYFSFILMLCSIYFFVKFSAYFSILLIFSFLINICTIIIAKEEKKDDLLLIYKSPRIKNFLDKSIADDFIKTNKKENISELRFSLRYNSYHYRLLMDYLNKDENYCRILEPAIVDALIEYYNELAKQSEDNEFNCFKNNIENPSKNILIRQN